MSHAAGVLLAAAACALAQNAHAEDLVEGSVYAAKSRPLHVVGGLGTPELRRHIIGVGFEWLEAPAVNESGWLVRIGVAFEHEADCSSVQPACPFPSGGDSRDIHVAGPKVRLPEGHLEMAAHARVGRAWKSLELEGGVVVFGTTVAGAPVVNGIVIGANTAEPASSTRFAPDFVARLGPRTSFIAVGFGSYASPTLFAPGLYVQGELAFAERWSTTFTVGTHGFAEYNHARVDLETRYRVTKNLRIGEGLAVAYAPLRAGPVLGGELRLHVAWLF